MNRIADAITAHEKIIAERLANGLVTQDKLDSLDRTLDMDLFEYVRFQDLKSIAVSDQTLTLDEGNTVYAHLGETPETFNGRSVAIKITLTELFRELLTRQM